MKRDVLGVVERAYHAAATPDEWRASVLDAATVLDRGAGVLLGKALLDHRRGVLCYADLVTTGSPALAAALFAERVITPNHLALMMASSGKSASMLFGPKELERYYGKEMAANGVRDAVAMHGALDDSELMGLYVLMTRPESLDARATRRGRLLGIHIAAGYRAIFGEDAAWLAPDGRVLDAKPSAIPAREALTLRVRAIEAVRRSRARANVDSALDVWKGMVAGSWSLVERFDSDGKRYLVARRNEPRFRRPLRLTQREAVVAKLSALGQSRKLVAYTLGLSVAMVSNYLGDAMLKLKMRSLADLMALAPLLKMATGSEPPPR